MSKREEIVWSNGSDLSIPQERLADVLAAAADIVISIDRAGVVREILTNSGRPDSWVASTIGSGATSGSS